MKEEIKAFLNNRRISQAIVGQVTGTPEKEFAPNVWARKNVTIPITKRTEEWKDHVVLSKTIIF